MDKLISEFTLKNDFDHKPYVNPLTIIIDKLRNKSVLNKLIILNKILNLACNIDEKTTKDIKSMFFFLSGDTVKDLSTLQIIKYSFSDTTCDFCLVNHKRNYVSVSIGSPTPVTRLFFVNQFCVNYFLTSTLLASYYINYILLICASTDNTSIINILPEDCVKYIGLIILQQCVCY